MKKEVESGLHVISSEHESTRRQHSARQRVVIYSSLVAICLVFISLLILFLHNKSGPATVEKPTEEHEASETNAELPLNAVPGVRTYTVSYDTLKRHVSFPAVIQPDDQQLVQITPLVSGRIEEIRVKLGDRVQKGATLALISSPQIAELVGKLHEAQARETLAKDNYQRALLTANTAGVLKAKVTLDEASATLARVKALEAQGLVPHKDLIAAESEFKRANAEYDFQKNVSLNREIATARTEMKTAALEKEHVLQSLRSLGSEGFTSEGKLASSTTIRAPIAGEVIERFLNKGAWFEPGKTILTLANPRNVWVIANVPEQELQNIQKGSPATVVSAVATSPGVVTYIDRRLNEDTKTARVRIELSASDERLKFGSYVQVQFTTTQGGSSALTVPEAAVQTVNGKRVVFVRESEKFEMREVSTGASEGGQVAVLSGLQDGEQVVEEGAFKLKSVLLKEQFAEEE
jgi:membrane fusion protein, heavy metal efflux system